MEPEGIRASILNTISALVNIYFLQSYFQGLHFNIQQVILMLETQKSNFEKYWHKGKGRGNFKKNLLCAGDRLYTEVNTMTIILYMRKMKTTHYVRP